MCTSRCLGKVFIINIVLNFLISSGGAIYGIAKEAIDDFIAATGIYLLYFIMGIFVFVFAILVSIFGIIFLMTSDKKSLKVNIILSSVVCFFFLIIVIASAAVRSKIRQNLQNYCDGGTPSFITRGFDTYDGSITNLGGNGRFCNSSDCPCTLFASVVEHRYSKYDNYATYDTHMITSLPNSNT